MTTTDTITAGGAVLDLLPATIRLWARANDLDVSPKGKIPESVVNAYRKAHGHAPQPKPAPRPKPTPPATRPAVNQDQAREIERLTAELAQLRGRLADAEVRADLPCPGTHCGQEATCPAAAAPALPEPLQDLLDAWHALFAKATDVDTPAAHTLAEVTLPALVRDTSDRTHDLVRLLDGDITP